MHYLSTVPGYSTTGKHLIEKPLLAEECIIHLFVPLMPGGAKENLICSKEVLKISLHFEGCSKLPSLVGSWKHSNFLRHSSLQLLELGKNSIKQ